MTNYEIVGLVISGIALLFSVVSLYMSRQSNKMSMGSIEIVLNERITATKERVSDITIQMAPLVAKGERTLEEESVHEIYERNFHLALENNLNAYEEACAKYLDSKVDRERFTKTYKREIRQLVENEDYREYFDGVTSPYKAILKVYDEWENLEK